MKGSSSWPSWKTLDAKQRAAATRKAFGVRRRLTKGKPVSEEQRRYLAWYEANPERQRKARALPSPEVTFMPENVIPTAPPEPSSDPIGDDSAPSSAPAGELPPLPVAPVQEPARPTLSRAQIEQQANFLYQKVKDRNAKNEADGKLAWPEELVDFLVPAAALSFVERHGGIQMSPKTADAVLGVAVGSVYIAGMLPAGKKKGAEEPAKVPEPKPEPAQPSPAPEERREANVEDSPV